MEPFVRARRRPGRCGTLLPPNKEPIMSRHTTRTRPALTQSRWQRDQRVLAQAQRAVPQPAALSRPASASETAPDDGHDRVRTFNWETEHGSPLRPRFLGPEERPDLASASLRLLVNLTAEG